VKTTTNVHRKKREAFAPDKLFPAIAGKPGAVWLDSSLTFGDRGRYSFIACDPILDIALENNRTVIKQPDGNTTIKSDTYFLDLLNSFWKNDKLFSVGYIGYEAALSFLGLKLNNNRYNSFPPARFLFYDSFLRYDHKRGEFDIGYPELPEPIPNLDEIDYHTDSGQSGYVATLSRQDYFDCINRIKQHIYEGDIYQANFTTRFDITAGHDPFQVYTHLRNLNPAPYSAYLNFGDFQILSSSPERMFQKQGDIIRTGPIKGTIACGNSPTEQQRKLRQLLQSEKDRAELLMIVDLMRNDLGRIARIGTVAVDALFSPQIYSSLIHLVSDISATLRSDISTKDIITALMPGGSITGAPKLRAVEIINQLEVTPRSVYTGCIGYVYKGAADFNIAIRTITHSNSTYHIHAGGGIVADSDPTLEYNEMMLKARNLFRALGIENRSRI